MVNRENTFQSSEKLRKRRSKFIQHQYFQVFHMNFKIIISKILEMIFFFRRYLQQLHRGFRNNLINIGANFLCPLGAWASGGFLLGSFYTEAFSVLRIFQISWSASKLISSYNFGIFSFSYMIIKHAAKPLSKQNILFSFYWCWSLANKFCDIDETYRGITWYLTF